MSSDSPDSGLPKKIVENSDDAPPEEDIELPEIDLSETTVTHARVGQSPAGVQVRPVWEPETPAAVELNFEHGPVDINTGLDAEAARRLVDQLIHCLDVAEEYGEEDDG